MEKRLATTKRPERPDIFAALRPPEIPKRSSKEFFADAILLYRSTYDDLLLARSVIAWRITRLFATERGMIGHYDTLSSLTEDHTDLWTKHRPSPSRNNRFPEFEEYELALGPPPWHQNIPDGQIRLRDGWCVAVERAGQALGIEGNNPFLNKCLREMTFYETAGEAWPLKEQIIEVENQLADLALQELIDHGHIRSASRIASQLDLTITEAEALIRVAEDESERHISASAEGQRAILSLRLEELANRAREAYDLRAELAVYKEIANLLGLHSKDTGSSMDEFIQAIEEHRNSGRIVDEPLTPKSLENRARRLNAPPSTKE